MLISLHMNCTYHCRFASGGGTIGDLGRPFGLGLWKSICLRRHNIQECINWKVERGNKVLF